MESSFKSTIGRVPVSTIIGLRHSVLRAGLPVSTARFDGDDDPQTWHVASQLITAAHTPGPVICCASFMFVPFEQRAAWRLRGMATEPHWQKQGWGAKLLDWAMQRIVEQEFVRLFWCDARTPAVGFYESQGWERVGEEFEIETAGPHYKMKKVL